MDYTVGQLAKLSGVTVRALHHYEKLGLLPASDRTQSGYRRYTEGDVLQLHRILACRQLGIPLKDIKPYLGAGAPSLKSLLARQASALGTEIKRLQGLLSFINRVSAAVESNTDQQVTLQLLSLMNTMNTLTVHYTTEELEHLRSLQGTLSPEARAESASVLADLLQQFSSAASAGLAPTSAAVTELASRWIELGETLASSEAIRAKTRQLIDSEPEIQRATGITPDLKAYIDNALAARRSASAE
ncbi:MerR family transcriptional regulator [Stenotrophomonas sp. PS02289]|uniref:MerR family transcriptional regulator n=1 Tax=Stenotrophomonas sp. PS02289 TaxID=2991422 RepID=UPI00249C9383|nr:MerR family transcriptional regulator [Stenotrophomonas sp. PS02289]